MHDRFICPNSRYVRFKKYQTKKNASGLEQSFKIYECEDCSNCPFKPACTKAKGNRQVHWNTIWEELKAKAQKALEDDERSAIYARRKVEVESVFGHIKGNRSFRRFSLRGLDKVHTEFGIVALAHNLLKVVGTRLATFLQKQANKKAGRKFSRPTFLFWDLLDSPFEFMNQSQPIDCQIFRRHLMVRFPAMSITASFFKENGPPMTRWPVAQNREDQSS